MSMLDKCIKVNFTMVENEIGIICIMAGASFLCLMGLLLVLIIPVLAAVQCIFVVKMYKKLFYTSLYGETALLSQSLPVSVEEMAVSRIFTAGTGLLMANVVTAVCLIIVINTGLMAGSVADVISGVTGIYFEGFLYGPRLQLIFLALTASMYRQGAFVLMAIVLYHSLPERRRTEWSRVLAFAVGIGVHIAICSIDDMLELLGAEQADLWVPAICMVLDVVLTVVFYRITVKLLKDKYALN